MKKTLIALAVAGLAAAPVVSMAEATIYGLAHLSIDYKDMKAGDEAFDVVSRASRLGFKGSEDLGNGLKAIYKMEFQIAMSDANNAIIDNDKGSIAMRNTFVGLAGGFGTVLVGRHDTPLKISTGKLDLFSDEMADYNFTIGFHDVRADNAVAYISPEFAGFTFAGAAVAPGTSTAGGAVNVDANGLADAYSLTGMYGNGPFYASLAYESINDEILAACTGGLCVPAGDSWDKWRIGLGLMSFNNITVTGIYENWSGAMEADLWQIEAAYDFGNNRVKAMYGQNDPDGRKNDSSSWAVGFEHNLSKRSSVYAEYVERSSDLKNDEWDGFSVGMKHNF
jgi:predicted porin